MLLHGSGPCDLDSDDDGIDDLFEVRTGTDPAAVDSDGDGIQDGTESGYTLGLGDPDGAGFIDGTDSSVFRPDLDPGSTTDPLDPDTDAGGVLDGGEDGDRNGQLDPGETDPTAGNGADDIDSDGDGIADLVETTLGTDPTAADTDGDGLEDGEELFSGTFGFLTDPLDADSDDDGLSDFDELAGFLPPTDPTAADTDKDGLQDGTELGVTAGTGDTDPTVFVPDADPTATTDATVADSDAGGIPDGDEDVDRNGRVDAGETDPSTPADDDDSDRDGVGDVAEATLGTDPVNPDTDGDGLLDGEEVVPGEDCLRTDAIDADSDDDGLGDGAEARTWGTDALDVDSDDDGIQDGTEAGEATGLPDTDPAVFVPDADPGSTTDPTDPDTDEGGALDGTEDSNGNGQLEPVECDPNLAADDAACIVVTPQPPVARPGGPYLAACDGDPTDVALDGSASTDPDGGPLSYAWTASCGVLDDPTLERPTLSLPAACSITCDVELTVTDDEAETDAALTTVTVSDTTGPTLDGLPADTALGCDDVVPPPPLVTPVDSCDPAPTVSFRETRIDGSCVDEYSLVRGWLGADSCGNATTGTQTVDVRDDDPPVLAGLPADETVACSAVVLPPAMVTATDVCDPAPTVSFTETRIDGGCADRYGLLREWLGADRCGNSDLGSQTVEVTDDVPPEVAGGLLQPVTPLPPSPPKSSCEPRSRRTFEVICPTAVSDDCDPAPSSTVELVVTNWDVTGTAACVEVTDTFTLACGEEIELRLLEAPCPLKPPRRRPPVEELNGLGQRLFTGARIVLESTAEDRCGNLTSVDYDPAAEPSPLCDEVLDDLTCCPAIAPPESRCKVSPCGSGPPPRRFTSGSRQRADAAGDELPGGRNRARSTSPR